MNTLYHQLIESFTTNELQALSNELYEAYTVPGYDGDVNWTDDAAEARYREMDRELDDRRFKALSPEDQAKELRWKAVYNEATLDVLKCYFNFGSFNKIEDSSLSLGGTKTGDFVTWRR